MERHSARARNCADTRTARNSGRVVATLAMLPSGAHVPVYGLWDISGSGPPGRTVHREGDLFVLLGDWNKQLHNTDYAGNSGTGSDSGDPRNTGAVHRM